MARGWHIQKDEGQVTLSRQLPARFDVAAVTHLPHGNAVRLANQIRQDLWRALRNVRGFSPVVQIIEGDAQLDVRAGGRVLGNTNVAMIERIEAVLDNPQNRARWLRCAQDRRRP
jgi:hypothetical protein